MIPERLALLRKEMESRGIDVYIVPTADDHQSEYVGEHFKARKYITGFTGSAGTAVITRSRAGLWTDGRYFLQAERQLEGSGVELFRMGEEGVPTLDAFLEAELPEGGCLGFNGCVVSAAAGRSYRALAEKKRASLHVSEDLVGLIWSDRPPLPDKKAFLLDERYAGRSRGEKLADLRREMAALGAKTHLLTSLYDIAWLLNVRGGDIAYVPVVLSYLLVTPGSCRWFVRSEALTDEVRAAVQADGIEILPYEDIFAAVGAVKDGPVLLDGRMCSYRLYSLLEEARCGVLMRPNPTERMKAIKNEVEIANTLRAQLKDAVALCRFICWVQANVGRIPITEITASDRLTDLRREQEGFLDLSFETICSYNEHASIIHYSATPETDVPLRPEGMLLVDSGGHYLEGTTDITRTFALGPVTDEMKRYFTMVARSHLSLAMARFLYGCSGLNLDVIARMPFWEQGLDYKHGTGHGVGYLLNVHEGPNGFRWRPSPERSEGSVLEEGMITTDEPGFYMDGQFGIRTENELLCRKGEKNGFGQFMYFENISYVPIDRSLLLPELLTPAERDYLNAYHAMVREKVSPLLATDEERAWLRDATEPV